MLSPEFKILTAFLKTPSKELYGREIERLANTTHERTLNYLNELTNKKILFKEKKGKQVFYKLNKNNILTLKALSIAELEKRIEFSKKSKESSIIMDFLRKVSDLNLDIEFILLFGSVARNQSTKQSDIDLLFVLNKNRKAEQSLTKLAKERETITKKSFSIHIITLKELGKRWLKEPVYRNIWDERIVLFGEEDFWRFILTKGEPHDG
ncbi:MAG: nucleotidyltransferase domain-containing protein [Candidatus Micrarchaeia archaeon]